MKLKVNKIIVVNNEAKFIVRDTVDRVTGSHIIFSPNSLEYMSAGDRVWHDYDEIMPIPDCGSQRPHKILAAAQSILDQRGA